MLHVMMFHVDDVILLVCVFIICLSLTIPIHYMSTYFMPLVLWVNGWNQCLKKNLLIVDYGLVYSLNG